MKQPVARGSAEQANGARQMSSQQHQQNGGSRPDTGAKGGAGSTSAASLNSQPASGPNDAAAASGAPCSSSGANKQSAAAEAKASSPTTLNPKAAEFVVKLDPSAPAFNPEAAAAATRAQVGGPPPQGGGPTGSSYQDGAGKKGRQRGPLGPAAGGAPLNMPMAGNAFAATSAAGLPFGAYDQQPRPGGAPGMMPPQMYSWTAASVTEFWRANMQELHRMAIANQWSQEMLFKATMQLQITMTSDHGVPPQLLAQVMESSVLRGTKGPGAKLQGGAETPRGTAAKNGKGAKPQKGAAAAVAGDAGDASSPAVIKEQVGYKKLSQKDYAAWAAATPEFRAAAGGAGSTGGNANAAGATLKAMHGNYRISAGPDGTKGFTLKRTLPGPAAASAPAAAAPADSVAEAC